MGRTNATSLWICNALGFGFLAARLGLRTWRKERWTQGDYWTISAAAFMIIRVTISHYVLKYSTTTMISKAEREAGNFTDEEIYWLVTNSKLNLLSRFALNGLLWSLKMAVFDLLRRIIRKLRYEHLVVGILLSTLFISWAAAVITIFVECRPFEKYWQLFPDPGPCVQANLWLLVYEIGNMLTDAMLLAVPFPLLFKAQISWGKRLRLCAVFSLGFFLIAVSIARIIQGLTKSRIQLSRTMWASIETLFACMVTCGPSIYCLIRKGTERGSSFSNYGTHPLSGSRSSRTFSSSAAPGFQSHTFPHPRNTDDDYLGTNKCRKPSMVHFDIRSSPEEGHNYHSTGKVSMWTGVHSIGEQHELDRLESSDAVEAEDASTKGILVATTLHQIHETDPKTRGDSGSS